MKLSEKRKEEIFRDELVRHLNKVFSGDEDIEVKAKANLWYRLQIKDDGTREPSDEQPMRGRNAFQQDIVIFEKKTNVPRVVIETKIGGCSTHDAITYSTKAHLIKQVYPFLRYILLIGNSDRITYKLIKHGEFFDAIIATLVDSSNKIAESDLKALVEVLNSEIRTSHELGEIIGEKRVIKTFWKRTNVS